MPDRKPLVEAEADQLRARALVILDAFMREEPNDAWVRLRDLLEGTSRLNELRWIHGELRGAMAGMTPATRQELGRNLEERFGPDHDRAHLRTLAARARARGRIVSERECRVVQAYPDSIAGNSGDNDEYLALNGLLDEFTSRQQLPDEG